MLLNNDMTYAELAINKCRSQPSRIPLQLWHARCVNDIYRQGQATEVGSGTYGLVFKATKHPTTDADSINRKEIYALKKLDFSKETEGFPITAIREIRILQKLSHTNIVKLHEIVVSKGTCKFKGSTYLVFEYMEHDFLGLIANKVLFSFPDLKGIISQLLYGVEYMHQNNVIHRANILFNNKGEVKIADFGLARYYKQSHSLTNRVVTLWYRSPELLLGSQFYTDKIDLWSIGCFIAELFTGTCLFQGDKEARQLEIIFEKCGTPSEENWPNHKNLPYYESLAPAKFYTRNILSHIRSLKPTIPDDAIDLIDKLLTLNPAKRLSASEALAHPYFSSKPLATVPENLPIFNEKEYHGAIKNERQYKANRNKLNKHDHLADKKKRCRSIKSDGKIIKKIKYDDGIS